MTPEKKPSRRSIGARRLLKLAKHLDTVKPERFDFNNWATGLGKTKRLTCGTTACALGHATSIPEFKELGLKLKKDSYGDGYVTFGGDEGHYAAAKLFRLSSVEAAFLFIPNKFLDGVMSPGIGATVSEVANHIRKFVDKYYAQ